MGLIESVTPKPTFGDPEVISSGSKSPIGSDGSHATKDFAERGAQAYAQTKEVVSDTYDKTTDVLNGAYQRVLVYGRQNPGTTMLVAFGAGAGVGLLLAASGRKRSRSSYYGESVVNAVSQIASELFRRR
jgi:ElaB/YqjD/DUF883 family membrane-anchored ribosome-binding protein